MDLICVCRCNWFYGINGDNYNRASRTALFFRALCTLIRAISLTAILRVARHIAVVHIHFNVSVLLGRCHVHKAGTVRQHCIHCEYNDQYVE